jgi:WD40 repeat protein
MVATVGNDYRIKIWSFDGQTLSATGKEWTANNYFPDAAFSPDSTRLVFPDGPFVRTFTVSGWVEGPPLKGDGANNDFKGAAFTPDGTKVISVDDRGSSGGTVYVHDINTTSGIPMTMKSIPDEPWSFGVSPRAVNGTVGIAVGGYPASSAPYAGAMNVLGLTGTTLGDPVRLGTRSTINKTPTDSAVFSTDGTILAQGEDYGAVRFWTFPLASTTPTPVQDNLTFAGGSEVAALAFAPNGMYYAVGGGSQLSIYGMGSPTELDRLAAPMLMDGIASIAFSPNGRAMILGQDNCGRVLVCY